MVCHRFDRSLLVGAIALERRLISRAEWVQAMQSWINDPTQSLAEILVARGSLGIDDQQLLVSLTDHERDGGERAPQPAALGIGMHGGPDRDAVTPPVSPCATGLSMQPPAGEPPASEGPGGRYQALWPHAMGGLGQIYVAEDTELNRRVALKEIQPQHAANAVSRARFLFEAQITANLEHPGIVPVHGRGTHADGRPFYAMRLVRGQDLAHAIRRFHAGAKPDYAGLEFRWLLRRLTDVCNTVAYAHSRGILHRDLKPGNVMLGPFGETLVMDWGLARPMRQSGPSDVVAEVVPAAGAGARESVTRTGQAVGTPAYMSPEQALGMTEALGPASDVYSLGATLYVMLTDQRPFHGSVANVLAAVRQGRFVSPLHVDARVPPALDAICRRAMATRPADRYQTPSELAQDIERWLADEPVLAWRERWPDRARRWIRRHQPLAAGWATAVGVAFLALALAVPLLSVAWRAESAARRDERTQRITAAQRAQEALSERARAVEHLDDANRQRALAQSHARTANLERDRAAKTLRFLVAALRKPDPALDGRELKVVDLLHWAVKDLDHTIGDEPIVKATLLTAIGETFLGLGLAPESLPILDRACALSRDAKGDHDPDTLKAMNTLASAYQDLGHLDRAIPILESVLARRAELLGENHGDTIESLNDLAVACWEDGDLARAIPLYEKALAGMRKNAPDPDLGTLTVMDNLAVAYTAAGRPGLAVPLHEASLAGLKILLPPDHVTTLVTTNNLARTYESAGRLSQAIALHEMNLVKLKAKLGDLHPTTLVAAHGLASAYARDGQIPRATALYETTLAGRRARLGSDHPDTLLTLFALARIHAEDKTPDHGRAVELAREFFERLPKGAARLPASLRAVIPLARQILEHSRATPAANAADVAGPPRGPASTPK